MLIKLILLIARSTIIFVLSLGLNILDSSLPGDLTAFVAGLNTSDVRAFQVGVKINSVKKKKKESPPPPCISFI